MSTMEKATNPPKHKLRWYQYSLRSLFILTTLLAIACSWYSTQMHNAAKRRKAIVEIEKLGGWVQYYDASNPNTPGQPPKWYSWMRKLHGDEDLGNAVGVDLVFVRWQDSDAALVQLKGLTKLECLWLRDMQVGDEGVKKLQHAMPNCKISREWSQETPRGAAELQD